MANSRWEGDVYVAGNLTARTLDIPAGTVGNADVSASADIDASKMEHRHVHTWSQESTTAAAAGEYMMAGIRGSTGTLLSFEVGAYTAASSGGADDRSATFDLEDSSGTSVLSSAVTIDKTTTAKTLTAATISTSSVSDGDTLFLTVATGGATGDLPEGLYAVLTWNEDPS